MAAARLGADVMFVCRIGTGIFAAQALRGFQEDGLHTEFIFRDESAPSGVALIMVNEGGQNLIAVAPGANDLLSVADIDAARESISRATIALLQLEVALDTVRHAIEVARGPGVTVVLNPAPARELDDVLLGNVSIITPNEMEAEILTGIRPVNFELHRQAAVKLHDRRVGNVVIALGGAGAFMSNGIVADLIPGPHVKLTDTTAAGDAFNDALACALADGKLLEEAVTFANYVGALTTTSLGAQPSLPTHAEAERFLAYCSSSSRRAADRSARRSPRITCYSFTPRRSQTDSSSSIACAFRCGKVLNRK